MSEDWGNGSLLTPSPFYGMNYSAVLEACRRNEPPSDHQFQGAGRASRCEASKECCIDFKSPHGCQAKLQLFQQGNELLAIKQLDRWHTIAGETVSL